MMIMETLTLTDAGYLADVIRAVERHATLNWYPLGTASADYPLTVTMRAFTHDGGGLWFDADGDVREAYVWTSGLTEHWIRVSDIMAALRRMSNPDNVAELDQPLATFDS